MAEPGRRALTGADHGPFNIFSFTGLVFVVALYSFPYFFVFTTAALELVSSEMEDAADILGAGMCARPFEGDAADGVSGDSWAASAITFLESIALFGAPALIAMPAHIMSSRRSCWNSSRIRRAWGGCSLCDAAAAITVALFCWQQRLIGRRACVADRQGRRAPSDAAWRVSLGAARYALFISASRRASLPCIVAGGVRRGVGTRVQLGNLTCGTSIMSCSIIRWRRNRCAQHHLCPPPPRSLALGLAVLSPTHGQRRLLPLARCLEFLVPGAVRDPRDRTRDRLLCRLYGAAVQLYGTARS